MTASRSSRRFMETTHPDIRIRAPMGYLPSIVPGRTPNQELLANEGNLKIAMLVSGSPPPNRGLTVASQFNFNIED